MKTVGKGEIVPWRKHFQAKNLALKRTLGKPSFKKLLHLHNSHFNHAVQLIFEDAVGFLDILQRELVGN